MSLSEVLNQKLIKTRDNLMSIYLRNNIGPLSAQETFFYKNIFSKYYTPEDIYTKFKITEIQSVKIIPNGWGNRCFVIIVNNIEYPTSIRRLAGSKSGSNEKAYIKRAMREAINEQINNFKISNPLDVTLLCPLENIPLGIDAQVDHEIPFHIIANDWLSGKKVLYEYDLNKMDYVLKEPLKNDWSNFHLQKAKLRWLSKEGNKYAHKMPSLLPYIDVVIDEYNADGIIYGEKQRLIDI